MSTSDDKQLNIIKARRMERAKRRREIIIALAGVIIVAGIFVIERKLTGIAEDVPLASHLLLYSLLSVSILLLILVLFFLIRNVFKLIFERRQKILGANLKTRLTLAFVALTLVPTIVLFIASAGAVHTTIERWFKTQVEDSVLASRVVAETYYLSTANNVEGVAARTAAVIPKEILLDPSRRKEALEALEPMRDLDRLSAIRVYYRDTREPLVVQADSFAPHSPSVPIRSFLNIAFQGHGTVKLMSLDKGGELIRAVVPIHGEPNSKIPAVLVAEYYIPTSLNKMLTAIMQANSEYQDAKSNKGPIKTNYVLILLMVALLVILIGSWFGMSIARDITDPIQRLADGTSKIASGDLNVFIKPMADDELGVLVRSFNKMTEDLRRSRNELIRVNIDLDNRRKYMETVLENVAAGVLAIDSAGRITAYNDSARTLLRANDGDILEKSLIDVLPETSAVPISEILLELKGCGPKALERSLTLSFPDRTVSLMCFANNLEDEEGANLGYVLVLEDMTDMVRAQRMAAWRDVARRIAHEIKNPLTPIQLNAQRIRRKYMNAVADDNQVLDQCTKAIVDQVEQLKNMVNEFSNFARMPAVNPVPNDLNALVGEVVELYEQANESTSFIFEPSADVPIFDLDREQMKRVMVNLLDNALAAVDNNGSIHITTKFDPELAMAILEVADNGSGVHPRDVDKLFEPYFSRKPGGTGLGLTIVSTIVADHNGFVRIKQNHDSGTRLVIELPVRRISETST